MRITPDMNIDMLMHEDSDTQGEELVHAVKAGTIKTTHKYVKREWNSGKWKYWYKDDLASKTKNTSEDKLEQLKNAAKTTQENIKSTVKNNVAKSVNKTVDKTLTKTNEVAKGLNTIVDKGKNLINKFYDDPDNKFDVHSENYEKKMSQIKETKEWKDIVAKNDPEYVRKNSDGTTSYLLDDYVVDKKHPVLDIIGDIAAGREVDTNEVTKESTVAGLKDYAFGYIRAGMLAAGVVATVLTEKFKLSQGSYDDDIARLTETINNGSEYAKTVIDNTVTDTSPEEIEKMAEAVKKGQMVAEATRTINEGNVIKAAQIILESDTLQNVVGENEYYNMMQNTLTGLSEEEIAALNLLLKQMRK